MSQCPRLLLHIDDDPDMGRLVAGQLETHGYCVRTVRDPRFTIGALRACGARVVILDVEMPELTGPQVLRKIKGYDGSIQVIMLSGRKSGHTVLECMRAGAHAYLVKSPEGVRQLPEVVGEAFRIVERWDEMLADCFRPAAPNQG